MQAENWSQFSRFINIFDTKNSNFDFGTIMQSFFQMGITKYIFVPNDFDVSTISIFSMNLFKGKLNIFRRNDSVNTLFLDQLGDLNGYKYRIYADHSPLNMICTGKLGYCYGYDHQIIQTITKHQKAQYELFYGEAFLKNILQRGSVDIILLRHPWQVTQIYKMEEVYLNTFDGLYMMVPKSTKMDTLYFLTNPFNTGVWILLPIVFIIAYLLHKILGMYFRQNILTYTFFGGPLADYQIKTASRLAICALTIVVFYLSEAYSAKMTSFILTPKFLGDPDTIQEFLDNTDIEIVDVFDRDQFNDTLLPTKLSTRVVKIDDKDRYQDFIGIPKYAHMWMGLKDAENYITSIHNINNQTGLQRFHLVKESFDTFTETYKFKSKSPFLEKWQWYVDRINEAGLPQAWKFDIENHELQSAKILEPIYIELEHLVPVFYGAVIGWAFSLVVFIIELIFYRFMGNRIMPEREKTFIRRKLSEPIIQRDCLITICKRHSLYEHLNVKTSEELDEDRTDFTFRNLLRYMEAAECGKFPIYDFESDYGQQFFALYRTFER